MKQKDFYDCINIDVYSATPKYLQLCDGIITAFRDGKLKKDDLLPSLNDLACMLELSRDTADKAYRHLKKIGLIGSIPGKGYYLLSPDLKQNLRICLLFNKLSAHKKIIYDAFIQTLGDHATVDFYIYNNDFNIFKKLVQNKNKGYSHYVMIPHFVEGGALAHEVINTIPKEKLLLLDKKITGVIGDYAAVFENFQKDIYNALRDAMEKLHKYHTIKVVFPENSYYPKEILKGIKLFCQQYDFKYDVVNNMSIEPVNEGDLFICVMEDDLVGLLERILETGLKLGKAVGLISYNETPLKKILLDGITTVSTDFAKMGQMAAEMILNKTVEHQQVPFSLTLRASL